MSLKNSKKENLTQIAIDEGLSEEEIVYYKLKELKSKKDLQDGRVSLNEIYSSLGLECSETELEIGEFRHYVQVSDEGS